MPRLVCTLASEPAELNRLDYAPTGGRGAPGMGAYGRGAPGRGDKALHPMSTGFLHQPSYLIGLLGNCLRLKQYFSLHCTCHFGTRGGFCAGNIIVGRHKYMLYMYIYGASEDGEEVRQSSL